MHQEVPLSAKIKYSLYATLIFFLIANPITITFTQTYISPINGFLAHTALFFITILAFMMIPY
jgi:hypothetical protein